MRGLYLVLALAWAGACSSDDSSQTDGGADVTTKDVIVANDAGSDADFGAVSDAYPAFKPNVPQVQNPKNNPVLQDFTVVPVIYSSDTGAANVGDFLGKLAASQTYTLQTADYGVGKMTVATPVSITDAPPANITDAEIKAWLRDRLDGTHPEWGSNDATTLGKTIFALVYPASTSITTASGGKSCTSFIGYHATADAPALDGGVADAGDGGLPASIAPIYAVIARCTITGYTQEQSLTQTIDHEVIESATDPYPTSARAFGSVDPDHLVWPLALHGAEVSDLCFIVDSLWAPPDMGGYTVSRSWSNSAVTAFHDPCVQAPPGAYFNTYIPTEAVVTGGGGTTQGVRVPANSTRVVDVEFYSDAPTSGPWTIEASEVQLSTSDPLALTLTLDRTTGQNGEKAHLTITSKTGGPSARSGIRIQSTLGNRASMWFTYVGLK